MRNPYDLTAGQFNELPVFLDSFSGTQTVHKTFVYMVPFIDDEDHACIGFYRWLGCKTQHSFSPDERLASVRVDGAGFHAEVNAERVVAYVADEVKACVNPEQFVTAIFASFGSLISYRYDDIEERDMDDTTPANSEEWFRQAMAVACPRYGADYLVSHSTGIVLRGIASAIGASPASIRKEDVAKAIEEWAEANPLPAIMPETDPDTTEHGCIASIVDGNCDVKTRHFVEGERIGNMVKFDRDHEEEGFCAFVAHTYLLGSGGAANFIAPFISECERALRSLVEMGLPQADACASIKQYLDQKVASTHAWAQASVQQASEVIKRSNEQMKSASEVMDSLRLVREPSRTITEGATVVEVCGRKFEYHANEEAPLGIPNYCHDYWSASQRLGTGGAKVTFDAADLFDVVLNETVTGLVGPPGVGKTSIARHMGHTLGLPVHIVQFTKDKPIEQLIGVDKIREGQQVFEDGEITTAMRAATNDPNTPHVIVFDEFDHAPSEVQSEFHGVVEGRNYTLPNGEVLRNHGNMRFMLTRNTSGHGDTTGRHAAANVSDSAFNSRIAASFNVDYMKPSHEAALMVIYGLEADEAKKLVEFAGKTRDSVASVDSGDSFEGMTEPVCLRHMISYCNARSRNVPINKALALCIVGQLPARDREVANELAINAMGIV